MRNTVVVTTTFYKNVDELRFKLALALVQLAIELGYTVIIVDDSPIPEIAQAFVDLGAIVEKQVNPGMGASRRQVFQRAKDFCINSGEPYAIVWTEPEKVDFINYIADVVEPIYTDNIDIVIPTRTEKSWTSYPKFQEQSEKVALLIYHEAVGKKLDPMFGPVAFGENAVDFFINCDPSKYGLADNYMQHVAPVEAMIEGYEVISVEVEFQYPEDQRKEEEGPAYEAISKKRFSQLEQLAITYFKLGKMLKDAV